jgi:HEAT repeat protein/beta-lactamase regulating signal transducer with metallopeptidase domain
LGSDRNRAALILLTVWLAGAVAILGRLLVGLAAVQWMTRRLELITDAPWLPMAIGLAEGIGIRGRVTFLRSRSATMPMACGIFRPSVVMPADADTWPAARLRIVLLHELAHVKRRDCLTHALAQLGCAMYWFNPMVWIAARRIRAERERACDDLVLAAGTRGSDYADQLLQVARAMRGGRFPSLLAGATLAMAHRTQLEGRLLAILDPATPRSGLSGARRTAVVTLAACAVMPLATLQPWAYAEHGEEAQTFEVQHPLLPPASAGQSSSRPRPEPQSVAGSVSADRGQSATAEVAQSQVVSHPVRGTVQAVLEGVLQGTVQGVIDGVLDVTVGLQDQSAKATAERKADPRTVAALTAALKDVDAEVREAAMHALIQLRDPGIFEPLVAALRDASADIREQAAMGLAQLRDPRALEALSAALGDQSPSVREQVVFALGQLGDKSSGAALAKALKDESPSVREQAAFALGQLRDPAHFDALAAALKDGSADVREHAAFALAEMGDPRAVSPLISALKDSNADVRHHAAFALGQLGDRAAVEPLVIALKDSDADVRAQVAFALGQLRDPRAIDALTAALKDASAEVRQQAAFALGQLAR